MAYAENTKVAPEKSRAEIEKTLKRYGADAFGYGTEDGRAIVTFRAHGRYVKFTVNTPDFNDDEVRLTHHRYVRSVPERKKKVEQIERQRWRALLLVIKAKLESIEAGIENFEEAFLPQIMLPDRTTVGEQVIPGIERAYETGQMPSLMPGGRPELEA